MYENKTPESIKQDILSGLSGIDTREGSYTNDIISPLAYELCKYYQAFNSVIPMVYVDETSGEYIDKKCAAYGIARKPGNKATATLHFSGTDGTMIPKGKVFITSDNLEFLMVNKVIISDGTGHGEATAAEVGEQYNAAAGKITGQYENIYGLDSVTNDQAVGGVNPESDSALVNRLYDYLQRPATSGNAYHYEQWAKEVAGVGAAKVTPLWNGPGTVRVLVVDENKKPVEESVITACTKHIETQRPIGATVTVQSATGLAINVAATIRMESSTTADKVKVEFENSLNSYIHQIAFEKYDLLYNRVAFMLLDIDGVIDYAVLTLNGGKENISIGELQVPVLGTVGVSEATT